MSTRGKWQTATAAVALACFLFARPALATTIVIVRGPQPQALADAIVVRLGAELHALGFTVTTVTAEGASGRDVVETITRREHAVGAVLCDTRDAAAVDVWVTEVLTGKTVVRRVQAGSGPEAVDVLVLGAIELLRASLLEIDVGSDNASAAPMPTSVQHLLEPVHPRVIISGWSLGVGVALLPILGAPPGFAPEARLAYRLQSGLFVALTYLGPSFGSDIETPQAIVHLTTFAATVGPGWRLVRPAIPLEPYAMIGVGALIQKSEGVAPAPLTGLALVGASLLGEVAAGVALRLGSRIHIEIEGALGMALPSYSVQVLGQQVATVGDPWMRLSLALAGTF